MYEVFFNDRKIVISQPANKSFIKEGVITDNLFSVEEVKNWFLDFVTSKISLAIIVHPAPEKFLKELFFPGFTLTPAAGGVVIRNNKLLYIFRNGKWDLPKGKIDWGETEKEAALREVAEECEIEGHQIFKRLPSTYHIFQSPYKETLGHWILKETHWFEMRYSGIENGTPQTNENITKIRWFAKNELDEVLHNTYENLKSITKLYQECF